MLSGFVFQFQRLYSQASSLPTVQRCQLMAKSTRRPVDKIERKQRLAQRPHRHEDDIDPRMGWSNRFVPEEIDEDDDIADEISSLRTNRAY